MKKETWFTVIGVYVDNWQVFTSYARATTAQLAMVKVAKHNKTQDELLIVGAVEGRNVSVFAPSDGGTYAMFCDDLAQSQKG